MYMPFKFIPQSIFALSLLSLSIVVKAQTGAHVHGLATLMMVLEGEALEIQFESPAANILGFETKAVTADEIGMVEKAEDILKIPETLFELSGSSCAKEEVNVDLSSMLAEEHHDDEHDAHENHDDEKNAHDDHGDEHHDSAEVHGDHQEDEHHEEHSEITANYRFICDDAVELTSLSTSLFEQFSGLEKINVMWVTELQQTSETLTADRISIRLR